MILRYLFIFTCALFLCSCGEITTDIEWYPITLKVSIVDENGKDFMNPNNQQWFVGNNLLIYYRDSIYSFNESNDSKTEGISISFKEDIVKSKYFLNFGPIDNSYDCEEDFIIKFKSELIWIHYSCTNHNESTLTCTEEWFLEGKKSRNPFELVYSKTQ